MKKLKLTCAHAIVKHLIAQKILIDGKKQPLFPGVFGIFGHGNVACLGQALEENNSCFTKTIEVESVYNRLVLFDGAQWHGVNGFYDKNISEEIDLIVNSTKKEFL